MTIKQLKKALRRQSRKTTIIIEKDGKKYDVQSITFSINNDDSRFVILHTKDWHFNQEPH